MKYFITLVLLFCVLPLNAKIVYVEYFFDIDPGYSNGVRVPVFGGKSIELHFSADLTGLDGGLHHLFIRSKNSDGVWSHPYAKTIYIQGVQAAPHIVQMEYFVNVDPGIGKGIKISTSQSGQLDMNIGIPTDIFTDGLNTLYIRARDSNGAWSIPYSHTLLKESVVVDQSPIEAEYFFDDDPGFGAGEKLPPSITNSTATWTFVADITTLKNGIHTMYVRGRKPGGVWSNLYSNTFFKDAVYKNEKIETIYYSFSDGENTTELKCISDFYDSRTGEYKFLSTLPDWNSSPFLYQSIIAQTSRGIKSIPIYNNIQIVSSHSDTSAPPTPVLENAFLDSSAINLEWSSQDTSVFTYYKIYRNETPDSLEAQSITSKFNPIRTFSDTTILNGTTYYYWIKAIKDNGNESHFSVGKSVIVPRINHSPLAFDLLYPINNSEVDTLNLEFKWHNTIDPDENDSLYFKFSLGRDSLFTELVFSNTLKDTFYIANDGLEKNTKYFWSVSAIDNLGAKTQCSKIYSFRTSAEATNVVHFESTIPTTFALYQNYPNPFNPITSIQFDLPIECGVNMSIFNISGQLVEQLMEKRLSAGVHKITWNASHHSSGVYFYKLVAGDFISIKKLSVVK